MPSLSTLLRRTSRAPAPALAPAPLAPGAEPPAPERLVPTGSSGTSPSSPAASRSASVSTASSSVPGQLSPPPPAEKPAPLVHDGILYDHARNPVRVAYHHKGAPNFWLSPDSEHPIYLDGTRYPTAEHLFQSLKFTSQPDIALKVRHQKTAQDARRVAHQYSAHVERGWVLDRLNVAAMDRVLLLKFTQHSDLSLRLLETGDALIVYATPTEAFWGAGIGLNQLDAPPSARGRPRPAVPAADRAARARQAAQEAAAARSRSRDAAAPSHDVSVPASDATPTDEQNSEESLETLQNGDWAPDYHDDGPGSPSDGLPGPSPTARFAADRRVSEPAVPSLTPSPERVAHRGVHFHNPDPPPRHRLHTAAVQTSFRGKNEQGKALMRTRELLRVSAGLGWGSAAATI